MDTKSVSGNLRYLILAASVLMQLCLGSIYAWSVFVSSLRASTGLGQGPVQIPYTVFYIVFPLTMLVSGVLLSRIGPRICSVAGGILFGGGWVLASLGDKYFLFTVVGIGLLGGIGAGFAYLVPLAVGVRWFPRHKGLVAGIAMAGFGGGPILISQIAGHLMQFYHVSAFGMFRGLGLVFILIIPLAGLILRFPENVSGEKSRGLAFRAVVHRRLFWLLYMTMVTGLVAGFTVITNLTKLFSGPDERVGVLAVALFAVANGLGRILWGIFFDKVKSDTAIKLNLVLQALLFFSGSWTLQSPSGFLFFAFFAGFNYGGLLVIHVSSTARHWGAEHVGQVYGWLSSSNIPAAIAPLLAGLAYDRWGSFNPSLLVIAALLVLVSILFHKMSHSALVKTN
ncbi:MAG: MFS transporter [Phycisphaerae bacterium]